MPALLLCRIRPRRAVRIEAVDSRGERVSHVVAHALRGPGRATVDFSVGKDIPMGFLGEAGKLEFRAEFFNILNHTNFSMPSSIAFAGLPGVQDPQGRNDVENPLANAGRITSTSGTSRQIQLALKILF